MKKVPFKRFKSLNPVYMRGMLTGSLITTFTFLGHEIYKGKKEMIVKVDEELQKKTKQIKDERAREYAMRGLEILKLGAPVSDKNVLYYANHALAYDYQKKIPAWVAEQISAERLKGDATRKNVEFQPDPGIDPMFSAQNTDYKGSGWSRGHMSPAGDNKHDQVAMKESFFLSNILPQNYQNNAGFWNRLEMYCRDLTKRHHSVHIISGPVFKPEETEDGKKVVKYQVIGENNVSVPTHLFKIITVEDKHSRPRAVGAFIVPNEKLGYDRTLKEFKVELEEVEKLVGAKFIPKVNRSKLIDLCKIDSCQLMLCTDWRKCGVNWIKSI